MSINYQENGFSNFKAGLSNGSKSSSLKRDYSMDVSYDSQDMMQVNKQSMTELINFVLQIRGLLLSINWNIDNTAFENMRCGKDWGLVAWGQIQLFFTKAATLNFFYLC